MTDQQGAPDALTDPSPDQLRAIARTARNSSGSASDDCGPLAYVLYGWRTAVTAVRTAHAQNPAEIEHVAGDVSKNGAEVNTNVYAELPPRYYLAGGVEKTWDQQQMRAFADATHTLRASHGQAPADAAPSAGAVAWPDDIDAIALTRYKVVHSHDSMFHRFAVVAGDGKQQLYLGRETECQNMTRKFAGAFLDGAFYQSQIAAAPTPQSDSVQEDAARLDWLESTKQRGPYCGVFSGNFLTRESIDAARAAQKEG